jgi:hypothetical protein
LAKLSKVCLTFLLCLLFLQSKTQVESLSQFSMNFGFMMPQDNRFPNWLKPLALSLYFLKLLKQFFYLVIFCLYFICPGNLDNVDLNIEYPLCAVNDNTAGSDF